MRDEGLGPVSRVLTVISHHALSAVRVWPFSYYLGVLQTAPTSPTLRCLYYLLNIFNLLLQYRVS
jgi:hypothetical protein